MQGRYLNSSGRVILINSSNIWLITLEFEREEKGEPCGNLRNSTSRIPCKVANLHLVYSWQGVIWPT